MGRLPGILAVALLATFPAAAQDEPPPFEPPAAHCVRRALGDAYPLEICASFHAALFHWLDSIAALGGPGMTAGKTRPAHRRDYEQFFGDPGPADVGMLQEFAGVRVDFLNRSGPEVSHRLATAFFDTKTLDDALEQAARLVNEEEAAALRRVMLHFAPRYAKIWGEGRSVETFLQRVTQDRRREEVGAFLADVAKLYGVPPVGIPHPRIVLAPVPHGYGTHAQAVGRTLLIEVRPGEGLIDQVAPIVHENAHFLFYRIPEEQRSALARWSKQACAGCGASWTLLLEALPTAIAQGVASKRFQGRAWRRDGPWYHRDEVDRYAKRIFPRVEQTLAGESSFDRELLTLLFELREEPATRRSP